MVALLFAIAPGIYVWDQTYIGDGLIVMGASYAVFVLYAWVQSKNVDEIYLAIDGLNEGLKRKRFWSQVIVPSIVGWPIAWFFFG